MKPDFSSEHVLDRPACSLSAAAAGIQSAVMRIEHREPVFRCSATWVADGKTVLEYSFELLTNGHEVASGESDVSRLYWDGDGLVTEFRTGTPDPVFVMTWRYELIDSRRLGRPNGSRGGGRDQDNVREFAASDRGSS
jgi:hypothetical protein